MSIYFNGTVNVSTAQFVFLTTELGQIAIPKTEFPDLAPGEYAGRFGLKHLSAGEPDSVVLVLAGKLDPALQKTG